MHLSPAAGVTVAQSYISESNCISRHRATNKPVMGPRDNSSSSSRDPTSAFALGMEGLIPEAICKMENLRSKHDVELGVAMALLYFHSKAKMVDR